MKKDKIKPFSIKNQNKTTIATELPSIMNHEFRTSLFFILRFAVLFILFEICYITPNIFDQLFAPINHLFASIGSNLLAYFHYNTSSFLDSIFSFQFSMSIKRGCDSIEALAIFICGVLAFPSSLKIKAIGLLIGSFIILFLNLVRIVNLFWIGIHHRDLFDLFHLEIWQFYFIAQSIILWLVWMRKAIEIKNT